MKQKIRIINRKLKKGLGEAVAKRTILRNGETWQDVAHRVASGNVSLLPGNKHREHREEEFEKLNKYISTGMMLMSGRHLQHGDPTQPTRNLEIFCNCATASATYILFYLLLNGSGVGRSYDDDMMLVDWDYMPIVRCVLDESHPDFKWGDNESVKEARHKYKKVFWFEVPDTREGWAQAVERIEVMAFEKKYRDNVLVLDFSKVREKGQPIGGMQNRPASGPQPLIQAVNRLATVKNTGMPLWKQTMYVDHYLAECVLVGGARRAARIATKKWTDSDIFDFINVKKGGFLWSANNSITVDDKFWQQKTKHSQKVLDSALEASYYHDTGEPGFINQHKLVQNDSDYGGYLNGKYAQSKKYQPNKKTIRYLALLAKKASSKLYAQIPNPCVVGDTVIATLDGPKTFLELAQDEKDVLVYAWSPDIKKPVVRWMRNPHKTREDVHLLEIEFDSGLKVKCTEDHGFYSFRGQKIQANKLTIGQSIRAFSMSQHRDGQLRVHGWNSQENTIDNREHNKIHYSKKYKNGFDGRCPNHKIVAIRESGYGDVYNGCVDDVHTYIILDPDPVAGISSGIVSANCGEISLNMLGGYCVIGDVVPYFAPNLGLAEDSFRAMVRALIRVNSMDSLYSREVARTNRIGVGMTGIHEFAWNYFGFGFRDLVNEKKSQEFWNTLSRFKRAVVEEAITYSKTLGLKTPHTNTTIKPAGTTSKLFGLSEGAHLPAMREYVRWVQFRDDDPLIKTYKRKGYPIKELKSYQGTTVVGFPTQPEICKLGMNGELVTAGEATMREQYKWLQLLEKYWIVGVDEEGEPLEDTGNQVSYTLKYKKDKVSFKQFKSAMLEYQSKVKCCSAMPQQDVVAFEYQPESPVTASEFAEIVNEIEEEDETKEEIDLDELQCDSGICPI